MSSGCRSWISRAVMSRYPWTALMGRPSGAVTVGGIEKNARNIRLDVSSRTREDMARGSLVARGTFPPGGSLGAMSRVEDASLEFNPFLPEMRADPYPIYHQLRSTDPVHQSFPGVWILTRYADCSTVIRDPVRFSSDSRNSNLYRAFQTAWGRDHTMMEDATRRTMLFIDPPDHTRLRNLVSKAFTARRIEALRPHIQDIVRKLLDDIEGSGRDTFDLIND